MKGWYKAAANRAPPSAQFNLKRKTAERFDLYLQIPPPGDNIPIFVDPFQVEYLVLTEEYIEWAAMRL